MRCPGCTRRRCAGVAFGKGAEGEPGREHAFFRFVDEGEDTVNHTYTKFAKAVLGRTHQTVYQIFDDKGIGLLRTEYNRGIRVTANSIETLGKRLVRLDWENLVRTVAEYNAAVQDGFFDPVKKDGRGTVGITPAKSNRGQRLDTPPFYAFAVTCGITFTFGGIGINDQAEVLSTEGSAIPGLFATGEIVGMFYHAYPDGAGLMKGAVFGRIAGRNAGRVRAES